MISNLQQIIVSKQALRRELARRPISLKLRALELMRDRIGVVQLRELPKTWR
jgi:hypothetical protein